MGTWVYRIVKTGKSNDVWYEIAEVYYDDDGTIIGWHEACPAGENLKELADCYKALGEAFGFDAIDGQKILEERGLAPGV